MITHFEAKISLEEAHHILKKFDAPHLKKELTKDGMGSDFYF